MKHIKLVMIMLFMFSMLSFVACNKPKVEPMEEDIEEVVEETDNQVDEVIVEEN